jgi:hypothetical protein
MLNIYYRVVELQKNEVLVTDLDLLTLATIKMNKLKASELEYCLTELYSKDLVEMPVGYTMAIQTRRDSKLSVGLLTRLETPSK